MLILLYSSPHCFAHLNKRCAIQNHCIWLKFISWSITVSSKFSHVLLIPIIDFNWYNHPDIVCFTMCISFVVNCDCDQLFNSYFYTFWGLSENHIKFDYKVCEFTTLRISAQLLSDNMLQSLPWSKKTKSSFSLKDHAIYQNCQFCLLFTAHT